MATTFAQNQALVTAIAAIAAQAVDDECFPVAALCHREYQPTLTHAADSTAPGSNAATAAAISNTAIDGTIQCMTEQGAQISGTGILDTIAEAPATAPVAALIANPEFLATLVRSMAVKVGDKVEKDLLGLYASFTTNSTLGSGGTGITDATLLSLAKAFDTMKLASNEDRYLMLGASGAATNTTSCEFDTFLALANLIDSTKVGAGNVLQGYTKRRGPIRYKGIQIYGSRNITLTGSGPPTAHNLGFSKNALALIVGNQALTNDSTHIQALSETARMAVQVRLAFDGTDIPRIALRVSYGARMIRNLYGVQVST